MLTDAANLSTETDYYDLCGQALMQCNKLKDRFAIFDVMKDKVDEFRDGIGTAYLKYGAAYSPYLQTSLNYYYTDVSVTVSVLDIRFEYTTDPKGILVTYTGNKEDQPKVAITTSTGTDQKQNIDFSLDRNTKTLTIKLNASSAKGKNIIAEWKKWKKIPENSNGNSFNIEQNGDGSDDISSVVNPTPLEALHPKVYNTDLNGILVTYVGPENDEPKVAITLDKNQPTDVDFEIDSNLTLTIKLKRNTATVKQITDAWKTWKAGNSTDNNFEIKQSGDGSADISSDSENSDGSADISSDSENSDGSAKPLTTPPPLEYYKTTKTDLYNKVKTELGKQRVVLPPSAAVAGVYARVDRDRGVWKAPANVSLASVLAPTEKITNEEQENLNVDPTAGKSINAIRSFTGKGTLIWGARTLAGNDNEWRYIPVRRLFNLIEESIQKATAFVVFESNNTITWLKVKSLIESYLEGLWRQGALAGSTPEQAFFVNIGLGKSMRAQDILEGRMIVEIGLAAVRPAEFIILKFSHKLQEA
ncbi:phage tail sheath C-terminal domain-containing protein [Moorena sp. SIO3I6]|nr:phage tail sheath C-terminal domain-containing protein [Moorena sp. SIO3I6]